jgi:cyclophilin family peptidyl-prolyl cis-trans isomerase
MQRVAEIRQEIFEIYQKRNPAKIGEIDNLLQKYAGDEEKLLQKIKEKYPHCPRMKFPSDEAPGTRVFFDFSVAGTEIGRVSFRLFDDSHPLTVANFVALCSGEKGYCPTSKVRLSYSGSRIHRIVKNFMIQGGDITKSDGTGGTSIYVGTSQGNIWGKFRDELPFLSHDRPGLLSMANSGPNTNR